MAKGALSGFLTGAVLAAIGSGIASVATMPQAPKPEADLVEVPAGSEFDSARDDVAATLPDADPVAAPDDSPNMAAPEPDTVAALSPDESAPQPQPAETAEELATPAAGADSVDMQSNATATAPVAEPTAPAAPDQPVADEDLSISTTPAQPLVPEVREDSAFALENTPADGMEESAAAPETPAPSEPETAEEPLPEGREPAQIVAITPAPSSEKPRLPTVGQDGDSPRIGTPAGTLTDKASEEPAAMDSEMGTQKPIDAHAAGFENPEGKPLMAIVLIDHGDSEIGLDALASFPYPLSFAVDATSPTAKAAMQRYREAGFEVLALTNIPLGATAADTEMLLRASLDSLPQAVGVMEGDQTGLQSSKAISDQTTEILLESGHGLVMFPKGLNTAQKLAAKDGVPAATVFRDFDAKNQSAQVIRRFLDQAAFKAGREENGVIMVGRLRAETISALLLWGLQDRANRVALAPVSAVLKTSQK